MDPEKRPGRVELACEIAESMLEPADAILSMGFFAPNSDSRHRTFAVPANRAHQAAQTQSKRMALHHFRSARKLTRFICHLAVVTRSMGEAVVR